MHMILGLVFFSSLVANAESRLEKASLAVSSLKMSEVGTSTLCLDVNQPDRNIQLASVGGRLVQTAPITTEASVFWYSFVNKLENKNQFCLPFESDDLGRYKETGILIKAEVALLTELRDSMEKKTATYLIFFEGGKTEASWVVQDAMTETSKVSRSMRRGPTSR